MDCKGSYWKLPCLTLWGSNTGFVGLTYGFTVFSSITLRSGLSEECLDVRPFTGETSETQQDIARAAVCLMPSRAEGSLYPRWRR